MRFHKDGTPKKIYLLPNIDKEDIHGGRGISVMSEDGSIDRDQQAIVKTKIDTVNDMLLGDEGMEKYSNIEEIDEERPEETEEIVRQIDNHFVACEAYIDPYSGNETEPISIIVPDEKNLTMIHDEHGEEVISLDSGRYRISLLDRV